MKIGIDCRTILNPSGGEQAGIGHYVYYLVKSLLEIDKHNTYVLFFDDHVKDFSQFKKGNVIIRTFPFYKYKKYLPVAYSQMLISSYLNKEKLDLFHAPANTIPLFYNKKSVVSIYDLAIYKFPKFFPSSFLNNQTFATKILVPKSLAKAKKIIAASKNTKSDIVEIFGIPEEKIEVVYGGVLSHGKNCPHQAPAEAVSRKFGISGKYILFLGTIEPRKNILSLIRAFRNLYLTYDSPLKGYQLILAGGQGWKNENVFMEIANANAAILGVNGKRNGRERRSGLDTRSEERRAKEGERRSGRERRTGQPIKYLGYVSHAEKLSLIAKATCFVFPSFYEGFGLPVLEAMSMGTPVITSNISSLPEITGREGALLIDPNKETEISDALSQILTDEGLREMLSIKGHEKAQEFTWEECARQTLLVYRSALDSK
jgi:glycosyltransferase involved in cell wall biosynthesis